MGGMGNPMAQGHNQMHEQMAMQGGQGNGQQPNFGPMAGEPSIQPAVMDQQMYGGMNQHKYGGMIPAQSRQPMDLQSQNYGNSLGTNSYQSNKLTGGTK
jgi:hypothetical protein